MVLVPAYGRDYTSAAAVKADWEANKDFRICDISSRWDGCTISKSCAPAGQHEIRYANRQKLVVINAR